MSTNGVNPCEDAEMADCDGDKVVTMMDVLKEQEDFEEDANAVLGASDDKNCTYSKGYVKRQAIYACMTCTDAKNDPSKRAGVCLACSLTCHENHELIELYTKRNFRCDCGNPKFNSHPCQFTPDKTDLNVENIYNQNFSGVYCTCHRPYPDPESKTDGDMIQCIICEDWLHCNHLDAVVPSNDQYSEMICKACMDKNEFLHDYSDLTIAVNKESMDVDVVNSTEDITNCNDNSTTEMGDDKENENSISDKTVDAQTENDVTEEANDENKINSEEKNSTSELTEKTKEESDESAQINSSEENVSNSETDAKPEIESIETQPEDSKVGDTTDENPEEKQSSVTEGGDAPIDKVETHDNRTQEQVEEDMLLADPVEKDQDQKNDAMDIVPANEIQSNTDEKIPETDTKEISTDESKDEATTESETVSSEEKENETQKEPETEKEDIPSMEATNETSEGEKADNTASEAKQVEDVSAPVPTTEDEEDQQAENKSNIDNTDAIPPTDQSETVTTSEQTESIPDNTEPEDVSTDKVDEKTDEQLEQADENNDKKDVSVNENNITSENSTEKESSEDVVMDENNIDESKGNDIQKDDTENKTNCDSEAEKVVETDILKRKLPSDNDNENVEKEVKKPKLEDSKCVRPEGVKKVHHGATFWPSHFRHKLCTCNECLAMYKDLSVLFLIDPEDTVTAYEQLGKDKIDGKPASQYEKGMAALSSLGRVQQINALTEYGKLRDKLLDFLKTFKDKKVIVKEEDIKAFFAGMKPVREPDGVYFCR